MKANELMIGDWLIYNKEITDGGKIHYYKSPEDTFRFAIYEYNDEHGVIYLSNVFVSPESRNLGFGNTILKLVDKIAKNKGAYIIILKVKKASFAYNWYNRHGYKEFDVDKEDNTMVWMKKEI